MEKKTAEQFALHFDYLMEKHDKAYLKRLQKAELNFNDALVLLSKIDAIWGRFFEVGPALRKEVREFLVNLKRDLGA